MKKKLYLEMKRIMFMKHWRRSKMLLLEVSYFINIGFQGQSRHVADLLLEYLAEFYISWIQ